MSASKICYACEFGSLSEMDTFQSGHLLLATYVFTLDSLYCSYTLIVHFQQESNCWKSTLKLDKSCEICSQSTIRYQNEVIDIIMVSLLLTLNIYHNFFYHFYCWLWTDHYLLGMIVQIAISLCWSMSLDQYHIIHWRELKKFIEKCFPKQHV